MKVDIQSAGACKVNVIVKADSKETEGEYKKVLNMFVNEGRISGFRKGRAPLAIIKKNFQAEISKETETRLCRTLYKQAVQEAGLKLVNLLELKDVIFSPETGIVFTLVADVEPEFALPKYKKIDLKPQDVIVTEEELDQYLERMRSAFAKFEESAEDYQIQKNDLVCMDYSGSIDGKPILEFDADAAPISGKDDFWVQVDEAQFVPQVMQALIGLTAGAEKTTSFKFDKTTPIEALRGQKADYEIKVKSIRKRTIPTDAELCKQLKVDSLEEFREDARAKMLETAQQGEKNRCKQVVSEYLLKKAVFDVPESELAESINNILDQMMHEAQYRGVKAEELASQREEIVKNATASAGNQVRMKYIIREIARKEEITASPEEVEAKIQSMAKEYNMTDDELRKRIVANDNLSVLQDQVVFDKTIDFLISAAK